MSQLHLIHVLEIHVVAETFYKTMTLRIECDCYNFLDFNGQNLKAIATRQY